MNDLTTLEKAIYRHLLDKVLKKRANGVKPENILFSEFVKDFTHALKNLEAKKMLYIGDTINDKYLYLKGDKIICEE